MTWSGSSLIILMALGIQWTFQSGVFDLVVGKFSLCDFLGNFLSSLFSMSIESDVGPPQFSL